VSSAVRSISPTALRSSLAMGRYSVSPTSIGRLPGTNAETDATIAGVRGMVCCHFRMQPGLKIRSNFGEAAFRCDVAELEKRLALSVPEDGYTFAFQDRRLEPKVYHFPGDVIKMFVG